MLKLFKPCSLNLYEALLLNLGCFYECESMIWLAERIFGLDNTILLGMLLQLSLRCGVEFVVMGSHKIHLLHLGDINEKKISLGN